jgi:putative transposase
MIGGTPPMNEDNVIQLDDPGKSKSLFADTLTEIARNGAKQMLAIALQAEVDDFLEKNQSVLSNGHKRLIKNGYLPERNIQTGIGDLAVKVPRVKDKTKEIKFSSSIIPLYMRRSLSLEKLLPLLYLKGISTGEFQEVLTPLLGGEAKNLSPGVISRLKAEWENEYVDWAKRDLSKKHYVYWWADGIYLDARMEEASSCVLVIIGVTDRGEKELIAIEDGFRESKDSWKSLLLSLKSQGLKQGPKLATGDGAMGFWGALTEIFSETRHQRCWCHKVCNVLDKMPKSKRAQVKSNLQNIWMAETKEDALKAMDLFVKKYQDKYPKAVHCLLKDKEEMLAFYDFPAIHWQHLRTSNPIESTFATVRHRTKKAKGCFSRTTILTMVFKLCQNAESSWRRIRGFERLAEVITGVKFTNGLTDSELKQLEDDRNAA